MSGAPLALVLVGCDIEGKRTSKTPALSDGDSLVGARYLDRIARLRCCPGQGHVDQASTSCRSVPAISHRSCLCCSFWLRFYTCVDGSEPWCEADDHFKIALSLMVARVVALAFSCLTVWLASSAISYSLAPPRTSTLPVGVRGWQAAVNTSNDRHHYGSH